MSHASYLRSIDTTPKLLHGNIFPFASYVNVGRIQYNQQTYESARYGHPCTRLPRISLHPPPPPQPSLSTPPVPPRWYSRHLCIPHPAGRDQAYRVPIPRSNFHMPNEFSEYISAAARQGLKPFGGKR